MNYWKSVIQQRVLSAEEAGKVWILHKWVWMAAFGGTLVIGMMVGHHFAGK